MKKYYNNLNNKKIALIISILTVLSILSLTVYLVYNTEERLRNQEEYEVRIAYQNMIDDIQGYINQNVSYLVGFSAFIETIDTYEDEIIYRYLHFLLGNKLDDIRNVSVLKDTTIQWAYPLAGNENAIGIDLSEIPAQTEAINRVKNDFVRVFDGPVDLVQGGTGFIIRVPIIKENQYWGMVSIVLKTDHIYNLVDTYSSDNGLEYLITRDNDSSQIIYGNNDLLKQEPLMFSTDKNIGGWDIYTVPKGGWNDNNIWKLIFYLLGIILSSLIGYYVYKWLMDYNIAVEGKNDLQEKYIRDRFTGIYTREYFNSRVNEEFSQAVRYEYPLSMIIFDLDHFKEVNDDKGHLVGDEVLLEIVALVNTIIRKEDVFARWGGDEFIILMPETELSSGHFISERIRREVENLALCNRLNVTISLGCSQWIEHEYLESWFLRTDNALYKSKKTGKNKVTVSQNPNEKNVLIRIDWLDEWNCGNPTIDIAHQNLLDRCNTIIESSLNRSSTDNIIINIESFLEELKGHFKDEIDLLKDSHYPDIERHIKIHEDLLIKGDQIYADTKKSQIQLIELFTFLINTVIKEHIVLEDHKYFKYLNNN